MRPAPVAACRPLLLVVALACAMGCREERGVSDRDPASAPPVVSLIRPSTRTITRVVGQPGFVDAYEQTSIYPKMTAYLEKWNVDIGDRVKKGDVLATLFVPELVEDLRTRQADVALAAELVSQAEKSVAVAEADAKAAAAEVAEAKSNLGTYRAEVDRWRSEVERLTRLADQGVISRQILDESTRQFKSSTASAEAATATIQAASARQLSSEAALAKAKVDVRVAEARARVADSEAKRTEAMVGYLKLTAPYDGMVVARNANTGDFVLPAVGDPSASPRNSDLAPSKAAPIFVIARTDLMRIYVDVPEGDSGYVEKGTRASVLAKAFRDKEIPAVVARTSWALNVTSRTLRAEIDLPNPDSRILPGMYAYGRIYIERPGVRALPAAALAYDGSRTFCWLYEGEKAVRAEIETGVSDGNWVEVTDRRPGTEMSEGDGWVPFDGTEQVILGDLSELVDGGAVHPSGPPSGEADQRAGETGGR